MDELFTLLDAFLEEQVENCEEWKKLKVVFSSSSEPGEGEHKIMKFIRDQRVMPGYKADTTHVVFGQDADLILLSLLTHEPNFIIMRESMKLRNYEDFEILDIGLLRRNLKYGLNPYRMPQVEPAEEGKNQKHNGKHYKSGLEGKNEEDGQEGEEQDGDEKVGSEESEEIEQLPDFDFERTLEDFVFLSFLLGNDFVPNVPSLSVYDKFGGLERLVTEYKNIRREHCQFLTNKGKVDANVVSKFLTLVAKDEIPAYRRIQKSNRWHQEKKKAPKQPYIAPKKEPLNSFEKEGYVSLGEVPKNQTIEEALEDCQIAEKEQKEKASLKEKTPEELTDMYKTCLEEKIDDSLLSHAAIDSVRLGDYGYRDRYYQSFFKSSDDIQRCAGFVSRAYFEGLSWAFAYYTLGPNPVVSNEDSPLKSKEKKKKKERKQQCRTSYASWTWYYPYYYAPLIKDLAKYCKEASMKGVLEPSYFICEEQEGLKVKDHGPVPAYVQLISVLPPKNANVCLPRPLARLLEATMPESEDDLKLKPCVKNIKNMFPEKIDGLLDSSGKTSAHTIVVRLPYAQPQLLAKSATDAGCENKLSEAELERNLFDSAYLYVSKDAAFEMKASVENEEKEKRDPLLSLILPDFDTIELEEASWEEGKGIVFGFEISGIVSQPTPCALLDSVIVEEKAIVSHTFELKEKLLSIEKDNHPQIKMKEPVNQTLQKNLVEVIPAPKKESVGKKYKSRKK